MHSLTQTIQVEYQSMQQVADRFAHIASTYDGMYRQMAQTFSLLEQGGWTGKGANQFFHEMNHEVFPAIMRLIQSLHDSQKITLEVMQIFQQAEEEAKSLLEGASSQGASDKDNVFGYDFFKDMSGISIELLKGMISQFKGSDTRNIFKNIGRALNNMFDTRGNVKNMDEMYDFIFGIGKKQSTLSRFLESDGFQASMFALDVGLGILDDVQEKSYTNDSGGINWAKTVGVNVLDAGINTALGLAGAGPALLVNAGVQVVGTVGIELIDWYNGAFASDAYRGILQDDANMARQALENADLGNVTKSVAEFGYDYIKMPISSMKNGWDFASKILQDPSIETFNQAYSEMSDKQIGLMQDVVNSGGNVLLESANFVDGAADLVVSTGNLLSNTVSSTANTIIQHLPVDNSVKSTVNSFVEQHIKQNNQITHQITEALNFSNSDWRTWFKSPW